MTRTPKRAAEPRRHPNRVQFSVYSNVKALQDLKWLSLDLDMRFNDAVVEALHDFAKKHGREIDFGPPRLLAEDF